MLSELPIILLLSLFCVHSGEAKCCKATWIHDGPTWFVTGKKPQAEGCKDGSNPPLCCGNGACNFFCCDCDRGCRGDRGKRSVHDFNDMEKFSSYDVNQDGVIDFSEANSKMGMSCI